MTGSAMRAVSSHGDKIALSFWRRRIPTYMSKTHVIGGAFGARAMLAHTITPYARRRYFACAMTTMADYEREVAPLKRRLFATALAPGADVLELGMGTGPNLQYEAACPVSLSKRPGSSTPARRPKA